MSNAPFETMFAELVDGRTELVFDLLAGGLPADHKDEDGVSLIRHCAYYGDVSAIRFLLAHGESMHSLGENFDLNGAAFHGHWRLCKFLLEQGADANYPLLDTGETPLHAALCKTDRMVYDRILLVLLSHGANPNAATIPGAETGGFMRDCRTKGETPLHRAAAFGEVETIRLLIDAGARIDAKDANGDTPLSWASWYGRPNPVLRELLYGDFRIHPQNQPMRANLLGKPHA
ncbi:MAG: ankyrin repeat domain-containing protein [Terracidiphilus sp.]|nr:ankyrin repeat domain-containing protein [Terracidiphilus sp.]